MKVLSLTLLALALSACFSTPVPKPTPVPAPCYYDGDALKPKGAKDCGGKCWCLPDANCESPKNCLTTSPVSVPVPTQPAPAASPAL